MTFRELLDVSLHNNMLVFNEDDELIGSYSDMGIAIVRALQRPIFSIL